MRDTNSFLASGPPLPCVTFRRVVVALRGPGQSPVLPFACCVGSLCSVGRCGRCSCGCRFHVRGAQYLVLGLCWLWRDVPFARQRRPVVGVLKMIPPSHHQPPGVGGWEGYLTTKPWPDPNPRPELSDAGEDAQCHAACGRCRRLCRSEVDHGATRPGTRTIRWTLVALRRA